MTDTETLPVVTESDKVPLDPEFKEILITQAINTLWPIIDQEATQKNRQEAIESYAAQGKKIDSYTLSQIKAHKYDTQDLTAIKAEFSNLNPKDAIEGMLVTQIVAVHNTVMEYMHRDMVAYEGHDSRNDNIQTVTKLIRAFVSLSDALDHHRGKGTSKQEITVQYVNVADGGQAIVSQGRGEVTKKNGKPHAP